MKNLIIITCLLTLSFFLNIGIAKGPNNHPLEPINLQNVITVSVENGDFTSPVEAINSILDAAVDNQYLIQIGPGEYDIGDAAIRMKEYVKIQGAGTTFTTIKGSRSSNYDDEDAAVVIGANNAALIGMSIENTGNSQYSIGIRNDNASPIIKHVKVRSTMAIFNRGISNHNSSSPKLVNVNASAIGDCCSVAIDIQGESKPSLLEVTASAPSEGAGIVVNNSSPFIVDSKLQGLPALELADDAGGRVVNNLIVGGVVRSASVTGGTVCRGNYDEDLEDVNCEVTQ